MDWFNTTIAYPGMEQRLEECDLIHMVKLKECQGALKVEEAQKKARGGGWFGGAKVRGSEEGSDELTTQSQAAKPARARTFV